MENWFHFFPPPPPLSLSLSIFRTIWSVFRRHFLKLFTILYNGSHRPFSVFLLFICVCQFLNVFFSTVFSPSFKVLRHLFSVLFTNFQSFYIYSRVSFSRVSHFFLDFFVTFSRCFSHHFPTILSNSSVFFGFFCDWYFLSSLFVTFSPAQHNIFSDHMVENVHFSDEYRLIFLFCAHSFIAILTPDHSKKNTTISKTLFLLRFLSGMYWFKF